MRVISVITIKDGVVNDIESSAIYEEQLADEVVKPVEKKFIEKCTEYGFEETEDQSEDDLIEEGYFAGGNFSINLVWSYI